MRASEVLKRYREGQRDFRRVNLRGVSFRGENLSGTDFSEADIRGTNFGGANLHGAKFIAVKAGLQKRWSIILLLTSLLIFGFLGSLLVSASLFTTLFLLTSTLNITIFAWAFLVELVIFFIFLIYHYKRIGWGIDSLLMGILLIAWGATATLIGATMLVVKTTTHPDSTSTSVILSVIGIIGLVGVEAIPVALCICISDSGVIIIAIVVILLAVVVNNEAGVIVAVSISMIPLLMSICIGWTAIKEDEKFIIVLNMARILAATGGTSFYKADLTNADFSNSILNSTDFRDATLTRTCWKNTEKLKRVRPGKTYLSDAKIRELVRTGQGENQNFDRKNLQGVYLQGANLVGASFIETNLKQANLQDVDLSRAKLVGALLDQTNLTGATLTGAFIENWNITPETKLNGIQCGYIFMRLPPEKRPSFLPLPSEECLDPNPRRKPNDWNKNFEEGEFTDFIKPMMETLDLYHNQSVDPRVVAIAFNQLRENNPEAELDIISIERRGENRQGILIRAETTPQADHSQLHAEYFNHYNQLQALPPELLQQVLAGKDSEIHYLRELLSASVNRPTIHAEHYHHQGDTMSDNRGNVEIGSVGGNVSGFAVAGGSMAGVAGGDISGTVTASINELPATSEPEKPGIKELLTQLQAAIEAEPELSQEDKEEALQQVKTLAEAGQNPQEGSLKKQAKDSLRFLKGLFTELPAAALLIQQWKELLPTIAGFFGL